MADAQNTEELVAQMHRMAQKNLIELLRAHGVAIATDASADELAEVMDNLDSDAVEVELAEGIISILLNLAEALAYVSPEAAAELLKELEAGAAS